MHSTSSKRITQQFDFPLRIVFKYMFTQDNDSFRDPSKKQSILYIKEQLNIIQNNSHFKKLHALVCGLGRHFCNIYIFS